MKPRYNISKINRLSNVSSFKNNIVVIDPVKKRHDDFIKSYSAKCALQDAEENRGGKFAFIMFILAAFAGIAVKAAFIIFA